MIYDLNVPELIRRFVPVWFRKQRNLEWAYAAASWCVSIHQRFVLWRETEILPGYKYNGLVHSLEWRPNDTYDAGDRRIYITVTPQVPVLYHLNEGDPSVVAHLQEGDLNGYYHLDEADTTEVYRHEFLVHIPVELAALDTQELFDRLDLYRYAGRRPAIRFFDTSDATVQMVYYNALSTLFNQP